MKKILAFVFSSLTAFILFSHSEIGAQSPTPNPGTYQCTSTGSSCVVGANNCNSGFRPGSCGTFPNCTAGSITCETIPIPTPTLPSGGTGTFQCYGNVPCNVQNNCVPPYQPGTCNTICSNGGNCILPTPTPTPGNCSASTKGSCTICGVPGAECVEIPVGPGAFDYRCHFTGRCGPPTAGGWRCDRTTSQCKQATAQECGACGCCLTSQAQCDATGCATLPTIVPAAPFGGFCAGGFGIDTAIGCIPVTTGQAFAEFLLSWGIGVGGGIGFVLIVYAGFMIVTSAGNPQKIQAGKELLTAAIMGLMLLIGGAYLLDLIGIEILNIPGFG